jgi:hypothetical protein
MRRPSAVFPIALSLGAIALAPGAGAREPIKIKACQTISQAGSYELAANLDAGRSAPCVVITADAVTIDLAGFFVQADARFGLAIVASPPTSQPLVGLTVRNGSIFGSGVDLSAADGSIVEGLLVPTAAFGLGTGISANGIVKGNTVGAQSGFATGISATGTVTGNYVVNSHTGIKIGQGSTVIGNTATHNSEFGIVADCPSNLTDNTAVNNSTNLVLNGDGCHSEDNLAP